MPLVSYRFVLFALIAGMIWGAIGLALSAQVLGAPVWAGVLAAPVIGLAVGLVFRGFRGRPPGMRVALALVSLYFGAGLFALSAGVADALRPIEHRNGSAVILQAVVGVWWGITFTGLLPLLWPLAYLTHSLLGRLERRTTEEMG
jgi:prepilin signal peptidase PulO-like enzyme (type II secretory pathway)